MNSFVQKHAAHVIGVLSGFDRVVFRGTIRRLSIVDGMLLFLNVAHVLLKDFGRYVDGVSSRLKQAVTTAITEADRPIHYLASSATSKEQLAREIAERDGVTEGPVCLITCVETCQTFGVRRNREAKRLELRPQLRKCLFLYLYQVHPRFGFMHTRIQSWFPFPIQVCLNGREWLARDMDACGLVYRRRENCFVWLEDVAAAQKLIDAQLRVGWPQVLGDLARQIHPTYDDLVHDFTAPYYWSVAESEWATDVMFRDAPTLARLYPRLLRYGMSVFGSIDVLRFLGRPIPSTGRLHHNFQGEVVTDLRERPEGVRIRHRLNANSIKAYDKQGSILRIETTINRTDDFRVFRRAEGQNEGPLAWRRMRKGIADLHRRTQVSQAANDRYLDALAHASDGTALADVLRPLCRRTALKKRPVRSLRPWAAEDLELLRAAARGEFLINGFRNRDLRRLLYPEAQHDRRIAARVSRQIHLLRAHGLVRKVAKTYRYMVTPKGTRSMAAILAAHDASTEELLQIAA